MIALYEKYAGRMRQVAKRYGPEDQAEENVQEAFIHLLGHVEVLKRLNTGQLNLYLMKTAQYITLNRNKSNFRREAREIAAFTDTNTADLPMEDAVELYTALNQLPERERDLLCFHYLWGYSYREISQIMGIRYVSVGKALQKARQHAFRLLDERKETKK